MTDVFEEPLKLATEGGLLTEEEARTLFRVVVAETPEELFDYVARVVTWARQLRSKLAILDVILMLGKDKAVEVTWNDGDIALRLTCEVVIEE